MRPNRTPSGSELTVLLLSAIGALTVVTVAASLAYDAVVWALSASLLAQLQTGLPWLVAGIAIGVGLTGAVVLTPAGGDG
ncbi:hypothetical protein PM023_16130 [Halorubrum ezzemoulense]|uniref:hypothetical protein n=1 Tax=Halorubrum ezzemoulense TaxID=337243 RepID=UPI00232B63BC|nr:hypothetical protein [Halorubrum ezzemoulense]MDB2226175.1 hypothetical protein [Halorubrum ezzemoulense]